MAEGSPDRGSGRHVVSEPASEARHARTDYPWALELPTRWRDNDRYGHLNNAVYFTLFETAVMHWLERERRLSLNGDPVRCFTVENGCRYLAALAHPDRIACAVRVAHIGTSSVRYELALFGEGAERASAIGFIVDVFVDGKTERPTAIPAAYRAALQELAA